MKNLLLLFISILFVACSSSTETTDIPALLDRPSQLTGLEWDNVQNKYQKALLKIKEDPTNSGQYIKIADVFIHEARVTGEHGHYYPGAIKVLDKALAIETEVSDERFNALLYKSSVMLSQHEFETARALALEALKINTYNSQLYGTLVDAFVELGDYETAIKMADKMASIRPDIRSYSRISYLREIHGDMDGAIEAMTLAAESGYPGLEQTAWARLTLGELYVKTNQLEKAKTTFKQTLAERPNYPFAIAALGKLELDQKNYAEAEKTLKQAAGIIPEFGFYVDLAHLYKETNRQEEFEKTSKEILVMLQDDVDSGHNMNLEYADLYMTLLDDKEKSIEYAKKEYAKRPKNVDVNKMLAKAYIINEDYENAKFHLDIAMQLNDKSEELLKLKKSLASL